MFTHDFNISNKNLHYFPSITIVTPTYNQEDFIFDCIQSVISQRYPRLNYFICDGGSSDNTVEIIKHFESDISGWRSGPDDGPYAAVNEVLSATDSDIVGWLNSDDILLPGALAYIGEVFAQLPEVHWLTTLTPGLLNRHGDLMAGRIVGLSKDSWADRRHFAGTHSVRSYGAIQQESTFVRKGAWTEVNGLNAELTLAADFDLWTKLFRVTQPHLTRRMIAAFRFHNTNRSKDVKLYHSQCLESLETHKIKPNVGFLRDIRFPVGFDKITNRSIADKINWPFSYIGSIVKRSDDDFGNLKLSDFHFI
jgi:glycosyltransferase involved in cell wall biosynthesis